MIVYICSSIVFFIWLSHYIGWFGGGGGHYGVPRDFGFRLSQLLWWSQHLVSDGPGEPRGSAKGLSTSPRAYCGHHTALTKHLPSLLQTSAIPYRQQPADHASSGRLRMALWVITGPWIKRKWGRFDGKFACGGPMPTSRDWAPCQLSCHPTLSSPGPSCKPVM